jgi:hypothetical protein
MNFSAKRLDSFHPAFSPAKMVGALSTIRNGKAPKTLQHFGKTPILDRTSSV